MYIFANPNPYDRIDSHDCVIRAISLATGKDWDTVYASIIAEGFEQKDMPSINEVWGTYLTKHEGFTKHIIPNTCPDCYTIRKFTYDHPYGTYILGTGSHVVTVIDGDYYDTWDSGKAVPIYYFQRRF